MRWADVRDLQRGTSGSGFFKNGSGAPACLVMLEAGLLRSKLLLSCRLWEGYGKITGWEEQSRQAIMIQFLFFIGQRRESCKI